jgi:hypothetical protein
MRPSEIKLEFRHVDFYGGRKIGEPGGKSENPEKNHR